jgi:hypothetical protein
MADLGCLRSYGGNDNYSRIQVDYMKKRLIARRAGKIKFNNSFTKVLTIDDIDNEFDLFREYMIDHIDRLCHNAINENSIRTLTFEEWKGCEDLERKIIEIEKGFGDKENLQVGSIKKKELGEIGVLKKRIAKSEALLSNENFLKKVTDKVLDIKTNELDRLKNELISLSL